MCEISDLNSEVTVLEKEKICVTSLSRIKGWPPSCGVLLLSAGPQKVFWGGVYCPPKQTFWSHPVNGMWAPGSGELDHIWINPMRDEFDEVVFDSPQFVTTAKKWSKRAAVQSCGELW